MTGVGKSELWRRLSVTITAQRKYINKLIARGGTQLTALCLHNQIT
jgi:hypothetical protein